jgi:transcription elongation GreA/GreB family factor
VDRWGSLVSRSFAVPSTRFLAATRSTYPPGQSGRQAHLHLRGLGAPQELERWSRRVGGVAQRSRREGHNGLAKRQYGRQNSRPSSAGSDIGLIKTPRSSAGPSIEIPIGSTVKVEGPDGKESFTIVGSTEARPTEGRISNESPVGRALLGRKKGEKISVHVPAGDISYTIVGIS